MVNRVTAEYRSRDTNYLLTSSTMLSRAARPALRAGAAAAAIPARYVGCFLAGVSSERKSFGREQLSFSRVINPEMDLIDPWVRSGFGRWKGILIMELACGLSYISKGIES